jgi:hypothetical protein
MAESEGDRAYRLGYSSIEAMHRVEKKQGKVADYLANQQAKSDEFRASGGTERSGNRFTPPHLNNPYPKPPLAPKSAEEIKQLIISRRQAGLPIQEQMIEYGKLIGITTMDRAQELSNIVQSWK